MDIVPNSDIIILRDVPLDTSYEHTLYFGSAQDQYEYFFSKRKHLFAQTSYQRINKGWLKIGIVADELYDCNYMMFRNTGLVNGVNYFTNKWFYAYIKQVEYINNVTCKIEYEIDSMQTWAFNYTVEDSFIEREHPLTDEIGENLVPENLETGEYMLTALNPLLDFSVSGYSIVMATTYIPESWADPDFPAGITPVSGGMFNGIYSGVAYYGFSSPTSLNNFIVYLTKQQKVDAIVSIFMCPTALLTIADTNMLPNATALTTSAVANAPSANFWSGYTVKNKKLLTDPYVSLYVTNNKGVAVSMPFEFFTNRQAAFSAVGAISSTPGVLVYPLNYKGVNGANYDEKIPVDGFPMCSYNVDTFKAWLAQNSGYIAASVLDTASSLAAAGYSVSVGAAGKAGNVGAGAGAVSSIGHTLASIYHHTRMPNQARGTTNGNVVYSAMLNNVYYGIKYIRLEFVKIIDEYFNVYGYATHRVKRPNIGTRPHWNYVKTLRANITGSVPCDELRKIASIFDNGITFWKVNNGVVQVGNYTLNNSPTSP